MAQLPEVTRILKEDLQDPSPDLETVINSINQFMETTYDALRDLDFTNNFRATIKDVNVIAASASAGLYPINVNISDFNNKIRGAVVLRALRTDLTYFSTIDAGITVNWRQDGNSLIIEGFGGLPFTSVTDRYTITLLVV